MDKKTISIISYITIIGWVIAFIMYGNNPEKSSLAKFHLKQSFGLAILGVLNAILQNIILSFVPSLYILFTIVGLGIFILWIIGIVNAVNEQEKPVPLVGSLFLDKFDFIK
ncbi:MAG: DUF4870 domain-containing protein [Flavobacterium sp.]|uniref:DUF4870 domain-containing protein n=1 Tax=Flavobacterium sp. TaxID=239 RepID=UPI003267307D